jgi:hypothetical protein
VAAAFFIGAASAMIAPHRIAEIQIARISGRTDNSAADRTNRSAGCNIACRSTHKRTGTSAY